MNEKNVNGEQVPPTEPQMSVNDFGLSMDDTVVVEEADRTVVVTNDETIIIDKDRSIDAPPANRPRKVYHGMWGMTEIAAFGVSLITILGIIALYLFYVAPSNRLLEEAKADRDRLERERADAQSKFGGITNTQERVAQLINSVDDFETRYLPLPQNGRTALYQRINSLIVGYGLTNTSGPDFAPLEMTNESNGEDSQQSGRARFQSLFPGVYASMTVEGSYQNLRRFIRDIETGNEFVLISSVELEPSENQQRRRAETQQTNDPIAEMAPGFPATSVQQSEVRRPQGRTLGDVVSLRLEMAAYFRRMAPLADAPAQAN
jgi:Tfp pilus assembly protein PilO